MRPTRSICLWLLLSSLLLYRGGSVASRAQAQEARSEEVVANLAAGRVVIYVAQDGITIGAAGNTIEPGSRLPAIVPLGGRRVGVLLGAVDWFLPASGRFQAQLDRALPHLVAKVGGAGPRLKRAETSDIEDIGLALLDPLRVAAESLHSNIELPPEEPLLELLLVDYAEGYGPEVWNLQYRFKQEPLRGEYWQTRILRPSYTQLYPPEKGQPRTLIEVQYPPDGAAPTILDLVRRGDPRLTKISSADEQMTRASEHLQRGTSQKAHVADATAFLRAVLAATTPKESAQAVAVLDEQGGFQWNLEPPRAPQPQTVEEKEKNRPAGAPTLRKPNEPPK